MHRFRRPARPNAMYALCACECGKLKEIDVCSLGKLTNSCGCIHKEALAESRTTHGMAGTPTYRSWKGMWQRCTNPKESGYAAYKDRVPPEEWKSFEVFLRDMGECPTGFTIERVNNALPYGPGNCIWASRHTQNRNRRSNVNISVDGQKMCLTDAVTLAGKDCLTVRNRIKNLGWSVEKAFGSENYKAYIE